jgi:hypothetical protein
MATFIRVQEIEVANQRFDEKCRKPLMEKWEPKASLAQKKTWQR